MHFQAGKQHNFFSSSNVLLPVSRLEIFFLCHNPNLHVIKSGGEAGLTMNNWINRVVILKNDDCFKSPHLYTGMVHVFTKCPQITLSFWVR